MAIPNNKSSSSWTLACEEMVQAFRKKDNPTIQELIQQIEDPNACNLYREAVFSLLFHASFMESHFGVKLLLDKGADPMFQNNNGTTVLTLMVKRGQYGMIRDCLAKIADPDAAREWVNTCSKSGWTPLMAATHARDLRLIQLLLKSGADPNKQMSSGWTAMHVAARDGNVGAFQALLNAGGDPTLLATHREFGQNLACNEVTTNRSILKLFEEKRTKLSHSVQTAA